MPAFISNPNENNPTAMMIADNVDNGLFINSKSKKY
jgi:hypothetical protein